MRRTRSHLFLLGFFATACSQKYDGSVTFCLPDGKKIVCQVECQSTETLTTAECQSQSCTVRCDNGVEVGYDKPSSCEWTVDENDVLDALGLRNSDCKYTGCDCSSVNEPTSTDPYGAQ